MKKLSTLVLVLVSTSFIASLSASLSHATEVSFENDKSLPVVYLNVAIKSGAVSDPANQSGITNFMGEMLLRGTKLRNKEQLDLALDQMGAQLEVETRSEAMIIRGAVLSSQLDNFLALLNEVITQPSFPDREIARLKSEVISQLLEELGSDQRLVGRKFTEALFHDHPYGKPVLGKTKSVEKLNHAEIQTHYNKLFNDKQLLIVGTGDADLAKIQGWADTLGKTLTEAHPNSEPPTVVPVPTNPPFRQLLIIDKPNRTQTQVTAGQVGIRMTDPLFFPLYLGNHAFGGGSFVARMMTEIRVKRGWSYGAYSYFRNSRQPRSWQFYLFPAEKDTVQALQYSMGMVEDLKAKGVTQAEYAFAQKSLVNSSGFMYDTPKKRVENKLLERTLDLPDGFMKTYGPELSKVTLDQINSAMKEFVKPDHMVVVVLGTADHLKDKLIQAAGVTPDHVKVVPYTEE
jgi:zinc protease